MVTSGLGSLQFPAGHREAKEILIFPPRHVAVLKGGSVKTAGIGAEHVQVHHLANQEFRPKFETEAKQPLPGADEAPKGIVGLPNGLLTAHE
jgi:hypothetical protein